VCGKTDAGIKLDPLETVVVLGAVVGGTTSRARPASAIDGEGQYPGGARGYDDTQHERNTKG